MSTAQSKTRALALQQLGQLSADEKRSLIKKQRHDRMVREADAMSQRLAVWRTVLLGLARSQVTQDLAHAAVATASAPLEPPPADEEPLDELAALFE